MIIKGNALNDVKCGRKVLKSDKISMDEGSLEISDKLYCSVIEVFHRFRGAAKSPFPITLDTCLHTGTRYVLIFHSNPCNYSGNKTM